MRLHRFDTPNPFAYRGVIRLNQPTMPNSTTQPDAATLPNGAAVRNARFLPVGQAATFAIKFPGISGRITNGGIPARVIRVGVASP